MPVIISGTVRDNLLYGNATHLIEESDFDEALKLSGCSFVKNLPGNLSYELTEQGEGLSAGQKQRLALARALLRKPKVLILDEATSNLDAATESALVDTLIELKSYITIVAVTHRDALLKIADHHLTLNLINED
jgi:ABC-type bacteriocin/lantibiotic exporter with double-glycine peptidase domain